MIAYVIDNYQLLFALGFSQAASKLLQPENLRFRWSQHHDRIECGQIDSLVEHIDGKHDVQVAGRELF